MASQSRLLRFLSDVHTAPHTLTPPATAPPAPAAPAAVGIRRGRCCNSLGGAQPKKKINRRRHPLHSTHTNATQPSLTRLLACLLACLLASFRCSPRMCFMFKAHHACKPCKPCRPSHNPPTTPSPFIIQAYIPITPQSHQNARGSRSVYCPTRLISSRRYSA
jgi:hypothetical protein